jgi:hypothetical protein
MPKFYNKSGVAFQYPDSWMLDETEPEMGNRSIAVQSPGSSFWAIGLHPSANKPGRLVEATIEALREEYPELEAERFEETVEGVELKGYEVNFICCDFTSTARAVAFRDNRATCLIYWQSDDRDLKQYGGVFEAMLLTFLKHRNAPNEGL